MPTGSTSRFALHNWRVPTRLIAIAIVPVVAGLVFAGLRVNTSIDFARQADEAERVAILARSATSLADALQNERDATALPLTRGDRDADSVKQVWANTDKLLAQFRSNASRVEDNERVTTRVQAAEANLSWMETLRGEAYRPTLMPLATQQAYSEMWRPLLAFVNELGFGSTKVTSRGRAVYAVTLAKASSSTQRALVQTALARDQLTPFDPVAVQAAVTLEQIAYGEFLSGALPEDVRIFQRTMSATDNRAHDGYLVRVLGVKPGDSLAAAGLEPAEWYKFASTEIDLMRTVELEITNGIVEDAQEIRADAERDALINGIGALLALAIAALLTIVISRSMVRGMGILRSSAIDVAEERLPSLVENLSKTDPGRVDTRIKPIPLFGRDEIGEVARAFDQVHSEAVRLAAEQALLRGNVNAIFTNLSRRNQGLIQRQLTLITDLENNEAEPEQLENLFKLDHLATRMRRNGENLLVLAGEEPGRRWTQPVPLVDVLRAAASEVEQYERVELFGIPETEIHGTAVNDLVHLLAELLENATSFSSPQTKVRVTSTRLPDGRVMIEIHDRGIGLTPEDFADINHKLAHPPTVDVAIARRMGLFVVGRLSQRHGIRVQLRPSGESAGTTSLVMLPEPITHGGGAPEPAPDDFQVSRIVPESELPSYQENALTAADFGFDESRYAAVDGTGPDPVLDPVGRSRQRQERRAALEAATGDSEEAAAPDDTADPRPPFLDDTYATGEYATAEYAEGGDGYQREQPGYDGYSEEPSPPYTADAGQPEGGPYAEGDQYAEPAAYAGDSPYSADGQYAEDVQYAEGEQPQTDGQYQDDGQYAPDTGYTADPYTPDGYPAETGAEYGGRPGYDDRAYGQPGYDEQSYAEPRYAEPRYDDQQPYVSGYGKDTYRDFATPASQGSGTAELKNGFGDNGFAPPPTRESVGFTENGLPRRQPQWQTDGEESDGGTESAQNNDSAESVEDNEWQSANDSTWQRASQIRQPQAGGVTPSGLPRRVPKANLVPGAAEATPQGGPQVSRDPDQVRGRLTNLRRGIQRGRSAGAETNGQGFGPDDQER